ncbi:MAG: ATP-binding protein [Christensenellaceae bacterium]|nr:ATP-binding protein [Christensenellaceae bacterium]
MFDITKISEYREGNRLEVKKAQGGLPDSLWETYSAFANTDGGVILLGAEENADKSLNIISVANPDGLIKIFWDTINNRSKTSANILTAKNVAALEVDGKKIIVISVPRAMRQYKPVHLNKDFYGQSFRRNGDGDYHCTKAEVNNMIRDANDVTQDRLVIDKYTTGILNPDTIKRYRIICQTLRASIYMCGLVTRNFYKKLVRLSVAMTTENYTPRWAVC